MKTFAKLLGIIPSIRVVPGGAIPVFFFGNTLLGYYRYPKQALYSLFFAALFLMLFVTKLGNILDYFYFLVGPLFFVSYLNFNLTNVKYSNFIFVLVLDAFIGYLLSAGNERSMTFIGNEPSHIARYFFIIAILSCVSSKKYIRILLVSFIYVFFNKSFTSLLFMSYLVLYVIGKLRVKAKFALFGLTVIAMVISSRSLSNTRYISQLNTISGLEFNTFSNNQLGVLTALGSRRLTQTYIGFKLSHPLNGVGIGNSVDTFRKDAANEYSNLKNLSNIYERENIEPTSFLAHLSYEIGYVNALVFLMIILLPLVLSRSFVISSRSHLIFGMLQLFLFSTNVFVIPWMFLAMSFDKRKGNG